MESLRTMVHVTNTTQLSTFDLIKSALLANATISSKFSPGSFYEFEPNWKGDSFKGYPCIEINVPETTDQDPATLNRKVMLKSFDVTLYLYVAYEARTKFIEYANAITYAIEAYQDTFARSGYADVVIECLGSDKENIEEKNVIKGEFTITFSGIVTR